MGDRANVYLPRMHVVGGGEPIEKGIYLYTHWGGYELPNVVRDALKKCGPLADDHRWNDSAYLNRVIFCQMVGADDWNDTTGYGISTQIEDNEHPVIRVDVAKRTVSWDGDEPYSWSFEDFSQLTDSQIERAWIGAHE